MIDSNECSLLTAVIFNEQNAFRFLKDRPEVDRLLPLTPNALAVLSDVELPILNTMDLYTDYGHRRVIARARRMERKLWLALEKESQQNSYMIWLNFSRFLQMLPGTMSGLFMMQHNRS